MKKISLLIVLVVASVAVHAQKDKNKKKGKDVKLETYEQKISYGIGYDVAQNLKKQGIEVQTDLLILGLIHGMGDSTQALMTKDQIMATFEEFQNKQREAMTRKMEGEAKANEDKGKAYIDAQMKANPNLKKTESGLVYEVLQEGNGPKPTSANTVKVNYKGTTPDGVVFDQTEGRGPAVFPLNGLIPGWVEGIQLMNTGSKYRFLIPANLAYGNQPPQGTPIEAGMTLVFEVELLSIEK
jgi:FKBP-type peptidyl-prolyl cis-trans isomerase